MTWKTKQIKHTDHPDIMLNHTLLDFTELVDYCHLNVDYNETLSLLAHGLQHYVLVEGYHSLPRNDPMSAQN